MSVATQKINACITPNKYSFNDVDPTQKMPGYRKALYIAIGCSHPIWLRGNKPLIKRTVNRYKGTNSLLVEGKETCRT